MTVTPEAAFSLRCGHCSARCPLREPLGVSEEAEPLPALLRPAVGSVRPEGPHFRGRGLSGS